MRFDLSKKAQMKWEWEEKSPWQRRAAIALSLTNMFAFLMVLCVSCTPSLTRPRALPTDINGIITQVPLGTGGLSCNGIGIPSRPAQSEIDGAKKLLAVKDAAALQILYECFDNVLTDGVHSLSGPYGGT